MKQSILAQDPACAHPVGVESAGEHEEYNDHHAGTGDSHADGRGSTADSTREPAGGVPPRELAELLTSARSLSRRAEREGSSTLAERLSASVVRPLSSLVEAPDEVSGDEGSDSLDHGLWRLARGATRLRSGEPELLEATAALQHLACHEGGDETVAGERREQLAALQGDLQPAIEVAPGGPYLVTNPERIEDWLGCAIVTTPQMALCRCGRSKLKPLCDGSHAGGFDDAKDPGRVEDRRDIYVGQQVTVLDNRGICQHSGLCTDRLSTVFRADQEPFVAASGGRMDEIIRAVRDCPSGALSYAIDCVEARDDVDYHGQRPGTIQVTKDGPYRITGAIPLLGAGSQPVASAQGASSEHYALCRCGQSRNKPFCSGMHWYIEFRDPVADPNRIPSMFEWAGGLPALRRMTRLFYEKFVPQDPYLAPLFADMSTDHPERVARWLGEVFGGPPLYSSEYGGYPRMLSQHTGKNLQEDWRQRWVALLLQSAREAGLPNDPEFRSAFSSYIEWGSRLAVENSQTDARPPQNMPMPRWDWNTGAGPPGSRLSAIAPAAAETEPDVALPGPDQPVSFESHVRQLFRERDRTSMSFAFDLWSYEEVREHAPEILERVRNGSMPCDGRWPSEWVETFARWINAGTPG